MAHLLNRGLASGEEGAALVVALAVVLIVFALGAAWLALADHQSGVSTYDINRQHAIDAADAGLASAVAALNVQRSYTGTPSVTAVSNGAAQYETTVTVDPANSARRVITATGYSPS